MRLSVQVMLVSSTFAVVASCGPGSPAPRPALQLDVAQYIARVNQWAPAEREAAAAIRHLLRSQLVDVDEVTSIAGHALDTIAPHVAAITAYEPKTPEVSVIHKRYARAWRELERGFRLIRDGIRTDKVSDLAAGRRRLEGWKDEMIVVADELRALSESVGVSKTSSAATTWLPRGQNG